MCAADSELIIYISTEILYFLYILFSVFACMYSLIIFHHSVVCIFRNEREKREKQKEQKNGKNPWDEENKQNIYTI